MTPEPVPPSAPAASTVGVVLVIGALLEASPNRQPSALGCWTVGRSASPSAAVFLSNLPESLAATSGLRAAGRSTSSIIGLWVGVIVASAVAAGLGYAVLGALGPGLHGGIQAFAAGGVLAMLATTMLPEAVDHAGRLVGLVTVVGFAASVLLGAI